MLSGLWRFCSCGWRPDPAGLLETPDDHDQTRLQSTASTSKCPADRRSHDVEAATTAEGPRDVVPGPEPLLPDAPPQSTHAQTTAMSAVSAAGRARLALVRPSSAETRWRILDTAPLAMLDENLRTSDRSSSRWTGTPSPASCGAYSLGHPGRDASPAMGPAAATVAGAAATSVRSRLSSMGPAAAAGQAGPLGGTSSASPAEVDIPLSRSLSEPLNISPGFGFVALQNPAQQGQQHQEQQHQDQRQQALAVRRWSQQQHQHRLRDEQQEQRKRQASRPQSNKSPTVGNRNNGNGRDGGGGGGNTRPLGSPAGSLATPISHGARHAHVGGKALTPAAGPASDRHDLEPPVPSLCPSSVFGEGEGRATLVPFYGGFREMGGPSPINNGVMDDRPASYGTALLLSAASHTAGAHAASVFSEFSPSPAPLPTVAEGSGGFGLPQHTMGAAVGDGSLTIDASLMFIGGNSTTVAAVTLHEDAAGGGGTGAGGGLDGGNAGGGRDGAAAAAPSCSAWPASLDMVPVPVAPLRQMVAAASTAAAARGDQWQQPQLPLQLQQQQQVGGNGGASAAGSRPNSQLGPAASGGRWRVGGLGGGAGAVPAAGSGGSNGLQKAVSLKSSREASSNRLPTIAGKPGRLPKHSTQVAFLQMLQFGTSGHVPLQQLATCDINRLSREVCALQWIGQGGGGAVFQGAWQGASVAVKFMLATHPAHVDATALEAMVCMAVRHPNVVHTYCAEVTRLTEGSFAEAATAVDDDGHRLWGCNGEEGTPSATALYNALMGSYVALEPTASGAVRQRSRLQHVSAVAPPHMQHGGGQQHSPYVLVGDMVAAMASAGGDSNSCNRGSNGSGESGGGEGTGHKEGAGRRQAVTEALRAEASRAGIGGGGTRPVGPSQGAVQNLTATALSTMGAQPSESLFYSEEGFGEPDPTSHGMGWTVRQVLSFLKARPGMYLTHIIMEHCDRGSLLSAIRRGVFSMEGLSDDSGGVGSGGVGGVMVGENSRTASACGGGGGSSSRVAAAAADIPSPSFGGGGRASGAELPFSRRVVLRALLRTARDVAQGMAHLHANGIIHGDLKPGNVLLRGCRTDRRGFVAMVADFGLSKLSHGDKALESHNWSTVTVMAPEVIMGRWLKASDVFSFGILLWQLHTGEMNPYGQATVQQILRGVASGTLKPEWPASAHPALVRLGRACLSSSPDLRPSFEAIAKVLTKIESHLRNELRTQRAAEVQQQRDVAAAALQTTGGASSINSGVGRFGRGSRGLSGHVPHPLEKLRSTIA